MLGEAARLGLGCLLEGGDRNILDRADGVLSSCWPGVESPDLSPSCKACTSKGVAEPLYLALIASRRFRRCSIRAASSSGSSAGAPTEGVLEVSFILANLLANIQNAELGN